MTTNSKTEQDNPKSNNISNDVVQDNVGKPLEQLQNVEYYNSRSRIISSSSSSSSGCSSNTESDDDEDEDDDDEEQVLEHQSKGAETLCLDLEGAQASNHQHLTFNGLSDRFRSIALLLQEQHCKHHSGLQAQQEWWTDKDGYNLSAFNQINGVWPLGHPLPLPDWQQESKAILHFDSVWHYEDLNAIIETELQRLLEQTHYDTIHVFMDFYKAFKRTRRSDLKSFFQFYDIPLNRRDHMCVSLAMEIMARIIEIFPLLQHYLYIVSCEEQVASLSEYIEASEEVGLNSPHANVEKEHAMVAMKISIAGREGVMILDPGYHVGRAVTVMKDQMYPHTGKSKF